MAPLCSPFSVSQAFASYGIGGWHGPDSQTFCRVADRKDVEQAAELWSWESRRDLGRDGWFLSSADARICVLDKLGKGPWYKFANSFKAQ